MFRFLRTCLPLLATLLAPGGAFALTIDFDYTYDTGDFFSGVNIGRRLYLDEAAQLFESHLTDSLAAIAPGGGNTWSNSFFSPATGGLVTLDNVNVPANTLIVYVGARDLGSGVLGEGGPGGYGYDGSPAWADDVKARGQTGALAATPTDFGPWGGSITFSSTASFYFDSDPSTTESFGSENDFFSVALHELGHLLGLGTSPSWKADISASDTFTGTHAEGVFGGAVPLDNGGGHWADGTESTLPFTNTMQAADLDPALLQGTRTYFTNLDYAGLQDIGWNVVNVPEASAGTLLVLAGALFLGTYRARK